MSTTLSGGGGGGDTRTGSGSANSPTRSQRNGHNTEARTTLNATDTSLGLDQNSSLVRRGRRPESARIGAGDALATVPLIRDGPTK